MIDVATGEVAQELRYDEFGRVLLDTNPGFQPFGFAGGLYDHQTGLIRFGARDYDPETGRWTAQDPIGFRGGSTNLYQYAHNNPVNYIDPDGTIAPLAVLVIAWGIVEVGLAIWDTYDAVATLFDNCASASEKALAAGGALLGAVAPGGGYDDLAELLAKRLRIPTIGRKFNQLGHRGWSESSVRDTVRNPHTTRPATNKATDNPATAYYNSDGSHVVVDNVTEDLVQVSDRLNPTSWAPDPTIQNPFKPTPE